jgi:hypothetical protein
MKTVTALPPETFRDVIYIPFSRQLVEKMNGRWSPDPVFVKLVVNDDGTGDLIFQRPAPRENS